MALLELSTATISSMIPHREDGGVKRSGDPCEEDSLDPSNRVGKISPLWKVEGSSPKAIHRSCG